MTSISIHDLDSRLALKIKEKAEANGMSINKTVKNLLEQALGLKPREEDLHRKDFEDLCGVWSETDRKEFEETTADLNSIDAAEWQ